MKVRYSRLWSLGNYENEKVELERDFPNEIDLTFSEVLDSLINEVEKDHERRVKIRTATQEVAAAEERLAYYLEYRGLSFLSEEEKDEREEKHKAEVQKAKTKLSELLAQMK